MSPPHTHTPTPPHTLLALLLAARLALGLTYSLITPTWEAYDEDGHFAYARYLAVYRHLLRPGDPQAEQIWERAQPPLYYLLIAPAIAGFDLGARFVPPPLNPYLARGDAGVNYALHPPQPGAAASQQAQAVLAARLVGVLVTTLSVLFVYQAAGRLWPRQRAAAWAATLVYAFWPQFVFNGSAITNDLLVTSLSAGVFDAGVLLAVDGFRPRRALALAGLLTAAMLTKINAIALLPAALLALGLGLAPAVRRAGWRGLRAPRLWLPALAVLAFSALALALLGSLNFVTGQVLRLETLTRFFNNLPGAAPGSPSLPAALVYAFRTYFAAFGWGNLETLPWLYPLWGLAALLAAAGLLRRLRRPAPGATRGWLLALLGLNVLSVVAASLALVVASGDRFLIPGRYLLPTLPAVACLLVDGWRSLAAGWRAGQRWLPRAGSLGVLLTAWLAPFVTLAPAYARPLPLAPGGEPPPAVAVNQDFGPAITLLGYDVPGRVAPGQAAELRLCWQARQPVPADYSVFLEVIGPDGQGYGRLLTYPGRGSYPTSFWQPGAPFCDHYRLPVGAAFPAPALAQVRLELLTTAELNGPRLSPTGPGGSPAGPGSVDMPLVVSTARPPGPLPQPASIRFGAALALTGYQVTLLPAEHAVQVDLRWQALRNLDTAYAVFVHLRDTPAHAYAQGDGEPRGAWYPTPYWRQGEIVLDSHRLPLPPGPTPPLALLIGVVQRDANERLPALDAAGQPLPDSEVTLESGLSFP